jgi:ATP-dependent Clp protease ATP-binding subunit ClpX
MDTKRIGFNTEVTEIKTDKERESELLKQALPQDFVKFGLIPEFIGRVPINVALEELDKDDLIRILTEPKNSLVKQYTALFDMDDVKLTFDKEALVEIARKSLERKTGARGLRAIMENVMMDSMYEIPSSHIINKLNVTKEMVDKNLLLIEHKSEEVPKIQRVDSKESA